MHCDLTLSKREKLQAQIHSYHGYDKKQRRKLKAPKTDLNRLVKLTLMQVLTIVLSFRSQQPLEERLYMYLEDNQ